MSEVKTTCPQCNGIGYCELEDFKTKKPVKCKCDTCEGEKFVMAERFEE